MKYVNVSNKEIERIKSAMPNLGRDCSINLYTYPGKEKKALENRMRTIDALSENYSRTIAKEMAMTLQKKLKTLFDKGMQFLKDVTI